MASSASSQPAFSCDPMDKCFFFHLSVVLRAVPGQNLPHRPGNNPSALPEQLSSSAGSIQAALSLTFLLLFLLCVSGSL